MRFYKLFMTNRSYRLLFHYVLMIYLNSWVSYYDVSITVGLWLHPLMCCVSLFLCFVCVVVVLLPCLCWELQVWGMFGTYWAFWSVIARKHKKGHSNVQHGRSTCTITVMKNGRMWSAHGEDVLFRNSICWWTHLRTTALKPRGQTKQDNTNQLGHRDARTHNNTTNNDKQNKHKQ